MAALPAPPGAPPEWVAIDGKALRGSQKRGAVGAHLLSAVSHRLGLVLGQTAVGDKRGEIAAADDLLAALVLTGRVVTADALLAQATLARAILAAGGDYLMVVKGNQPTLAEDLHVLFADPPEEPAQAEEHALHGSRIERRRLAASPALAGYSGWPGLRQALRLERRVTDKRTGAARTEVEELIRRDPDSVPGHYALGLVCYAERDLAGAAEAYRRVLVLQPDHHDARANLALMLKLAQRDAEATPEFLAAAEAGVGRAQYFAGAAYAEGLGVAPSLPTAVRWWMRAAEQNVAAAEEALASLRLVALGRSRRASADRLAAEEAFREYREGLWSEVPGLARESGESVGAALLRGGRAGEAVTMLIREAAALDEAAQAQLELLYERGVPGVLPAYDARILRWFQRAAAEGLTRPRIALARVYGRGLGVPQDVPRALALLHATPHEDARRLLDELTQ